MRKLLLLVFTLALIVGCGGGDGSDGFDDDFNRTVAENFANRFVNALNSNDVDRVAPLVSSSYSTGSWNRSDFLNAYDDDIRSGYRYELDLLEVTDEEGFGDEGTFRVMVLDGNTGNQSTLLVGIAREGGA